MTAASSQPTKAKVFDRALISISAVVVLGTFMSILDTTIVNVAINTLSKDFNTSLATIQWVSTGYMLALATVIPLTGWAADRFGTKRLYMISIGLFLAGSALSGLAWSAESLIGFRILQGLGGGMIMPAGMTILSQAAGPQRMGRVMGIVGVPMLMGPIIGPILGGWLVDDISWRWIFYVNIPIGAVALVAASKLLPRDAPAAHQRLDWLGLLLLSPGLAAFVYGLAETSSSGGIGAPQAFVPMVAGALLIATFIFHAARHAWPLIDVKLFRNRTMSAASTTTFAFAAAMFGAMFMLPLYYQVVRGQSALDAGLLLAPQGVGAALMMPVAGKLTDDIGPGKVVLGGLGLLLLGMLGFTQVGAHTSFWFLGSSQFLMGLGMGATMMPAMSAAYQTLQHDQLARATTALNIIQRVGGSIGTATLSVVLTHQLSSRLPGGSEGGLAAAQSVPAAARDRVAPDIAEAFGHTFWWSAAIIALAVIPALLLPRHKPAAPEAGEAPSAAETQVLVEA
ncbi:MAG TPA: DHA2 family efflux MFS transporter permease subunit [Baekduia sp.]|uniref:DHA2 family efflux MFS transporter permease subunit n=1 Tax=Baekduia sp. TaxID=2600305 RepID=UPI002C5E961A|nr:DHA2 family efflux MFS transporter permease subunit [Baekduia sp.]HMJ32961.1 DHA2 family efflux MFS transporter permease subunit [Baekduia sp.]